MRTQQGAGETHEMGDGTDTAGHDGIERSSGAKRRDNSSAEPQAGWQLGRPSDTAARRTKAIFFRVRSSRVR